MEDEPFGEILEQELREAVQFGEVLREYPYDRPHQSCLLFGMTMAGRPIHLVCAFDETADEAIVITVYQPDPSIWVDFKIRRKA